MRHYRLVKESSKQIAVITVEPAVQRFLRESEHLGHRFEMKVLKYQVFLRLGYFVLLLTHFTGDEALHSLWMLQPK